MATGDISRPADDAETRSLLAAIVESSVNAPIASVGMEGCVLSSSPGAEAIYGCTVAGVTSRHISMLCPADRPRSSSRFSGAATPGAAGAVTSRLSRYARTAPSLTWGRCVPIRGEGGVIVGAERYLRCRRAQLRQSRATAAEAGRRGSARIRPQSGLRGRNSHQFRPAQPRSWGTTASQPRQPPVTPWYEPGSRGSRPLPARRAPARQEAGL